MIKSLKSVNFTLQEIKEYMINKDDKLFLNKQEEIKNEIDNLYIEAKNKYVKK